MKDAAVEMAKLICLLLAFGFGCALAWRYPINTSRKASCRKSCLKFAEFLKSGNDGAKDPVEQARIFCINPILHFHERHDCKRVAKFSKLVHIYVKAGIPKHRVCRLKKICPDSERNPLRNKLHGKKNKSKYGNKNIIKQSTLCKACRVVVGTVSFGIKIFNYTEQKTKSVIEFLCKLTPLPVQTKVCKVVIDEIDRVFQMILKGVSPGNICSKLGICTNSTLTNDDAFLMETFSKEMLNRPLVDSLPYYLNRAVEMHKGLPMVVEKYQAWSENKNEIQSNTTCELCLTVTNIISSSIKYANATIEAIEEAVKLLCNMQPEPMKRVCNGFLSKINEIIQYIEKGLSPGDICKKLGLCPKETTASKDVPKPGRKEPSKSFCKACDSINKVFDEEMKEYKKSASKMRSYLTDICTNSQKTEIQEKCLSIAPVFSIIDSVIDNTLHPSVCRKIACNKVIEIVSSTLTSNKTTPCDICQYFVNMFMKRIKYFEDLIEKSLTEVDTLCDMVVYKEWAKKCHSSVNRTRAVFQAIVKKLNPKAICTALKFCPKNQTKETSLYDNLVNIMSSGSVPTCGICKMAIESVRSDQNSRMAKKTLQESCNGMRILAGKNVCKKLLQHVDTILSDEEVKKTPEDACKELKLCEKEVPVMKVIGDIVDGIKDLFSDW